MIGHVIKEYCSNIIQKYIKCVKRSDPRFGFFLVNHNNVKRAYPQRRLTAREKQRQMSKFESHMSIVQYINAI